MFSVVHRAAAVEPCATGQTCSRCGMTLQSGPGIAAWPEGAPVVNSAAGGGEQMAVVEGLHPGALPECRPPM